MSKKDKKPEVKPNVTEGGTNKIPEAPQPEQKITEDQAFMQYMNQLMSGIILEHENTKAGSIEAVRNIGQKLNLYIREVSRLAKENETLKKQVEELKKKK